MAAEIGAYIAIAAAGYVLGSFPTAYMVVKHLAGKNVLEYGSGNVGTLNTHRATESKFLTVLVLVGDMLKGLAAVFLGLLVARALDLDSKTGAAIGGILALTGHNYSLFLKFSGGKGIAISCAILLYFAPLLPAVWIGFFLLTVAATRLMVLGQILATIGTPIVAHLVYPEVAWVVDIMAVLVFVRHAPRLKNIVQGTEPKLYYKIRSTDEAEAD